MMKLSPNTKSDLKALAVTLALSFILAVLLYGMAGCTVIDTLSAAVEQSRQYCDSISAAIEAYQECMKRETFLNPTQ